MPPHYLLHIGQQKSGTTYLQTVLFDCGQDRLRSAGLCYPLSPVADAPENNQQYAMFGLLGQEIDWVGRDWQDIQKPAWAAVSAEARAWDGPVLLSAEALSVVRTRGIRKLLGELDAADPTVLITTRDLGATLASSWQQHVRNGRTATFEQYLDRLGRDRKRFDSDLESAADMGFWRSYAVGRLARRWADEVGADNVRVVTSPGRPIELLWARFCEALEVPGLADLPDSKRTEKPVHVSLTASEAAVLREVNVEFDKFGLTGSAAATLRTLLITKLRERADRGPRIAIPESYRETVAAWSDEDLSELAEVGVKVYGALEDIRYQPAAGTATDLTAEKTAHAAGIAVAAMLHRTSSRHVPTFPEVLRSFMNKWKWDIKRWLLNRWRSLTVLIVFAAVTRPPSRGPSPDGLAAQMFDSVHDSFQFVLSAGYG
jgi:hypothetical protein